MPNGYDPAAFDIVREEYRERDDRPDPRDDRDSRDIRDFLPERERDDNRERPPPPQTADDKIVQAALEIITNNDSVVLDSGIVEMINDPEIRMTRNGEMARRTGRGVIRRSGQFARQSLIPNLPVPRTRRKAKNTPYRRAYKAAFKRLKPSNMTKSGKWKKGGFKRVVQASHKAARKQSKK